MRRPLAGRFLVVATLRVVACCSILGVYSAVTQYMKTPMSRYEQGLLGLGFEDVGLVAYLIFRVSVKKWLR